MGVPLNHPFFSWIFHNINDTFRATPHDYGNPDISGSDFQVHRARSRCVRCRAGRPTEDFPQVLAQNMGSRWGKLYNINVETIGKPLGKGHAPISVLGYLCFIVVPYRPATAPC